MAGLFIQEAKVPGRERYQIILETYLVHACMDMLGIFRITSKLTIDHLLIKLLFLIKII